jgi:hypothetical protein
MGSHSKGLATCVFAACDLEYSFLIKKLSTSMPVTSELGKPRQEDQEFEGSLNSTVNSRLAWATKQDPVSKSKPKPNKNKKDYLFLDRSDNNSSEKRKTIQNSLNANYFSHTK